MTQAAVSPAAPGDRQAWYALAVAGLVVAGAGATMLAGARPAWLLATLDRLSPTGHYGARPQNAFVMALLAGLWCAAAFADAGRRRIPLATLWPPRPAWLHLYGLVALVLFVLWNYRLAPVPDWLWVEDGFYEYLTVLLLFAATGWFVVATGRAWGTGERGSALVTAFAAFVLFAFAMEEISWGQRILGLQTPAELAAINHQQEINVHNLFIHTNDLIRLAAALAVATAFVLGDRRLARLLPWRPLRPLLPERGVAPYLVLFLAGVAHDELFEAIAAPLVLLYARDCARRAGRSRLQPAQGG